MEFLYEYGLFLAKAATVVISIALVIGLVAGAALKQKQSKKGELTLDNLTEDFEEDKASLQKALMSKSEAKAFDKEQKKAEKLEKKQQKKATKDDESSANQTKNKLFVIEFDGDVEASATESLREEISAIASMAKEGDEVLIKLESPGGLVHGYGLAASQLSRLKERGIKLTASVDKVAASGGYMMACVADRIVAAPFAIIGSIGVVAQLPNINKLLKKHDIEVEQHTAGEFKRTLTVIGENTDKAREKFKEELEETHVLFKEFVAENRPSIEIDNVATGEHWYGVQAVKLNLIDEIKTSDDLIIESHEQFDVYQVQYKIKHNLAEKFGVAASVAMTKTLGKMTTWSTTNTK